MEKLRIIVEMPMGATMPTTTSWLAELTKAAQLERPEGTRGGCKRSVRSA
jgi:hypothetical protein